jgi:hypothetical protein
VNVLSVDFLHCAFELIGVLVCKGVGGGNRSNYAENCRPHRAYLVSRANKRPGFVHPCPFKALYIFIACFLSSRV